MEVSAGSDGSVAPIPAPPVHASPRACEECKRKKTKCDMQKPICSACVKTQTTCVFPSRRKTPVRKKAIEKSVSKSQENIEEIGMLHCYGIESRPLTHDSLRYKERILKDLDRETLERLLSDSRNEDKGASSSSVPDSPPKSRTSSFSRPQGPSDGTTFQFNAPQLSHQTDLNDPSIMMVTSNRGSLSDPMCDAPFSDIWYHGHQSQIDPFVVAPISDIFATQIGRGSDQFLGSASEIIYDSYSASPGHQLSPLQSPGGQLIEPLHRAEHISDNGSNLYSLKIPASVVEQLIALYFETVQAFLPLFHRSKFYARYVKHNLDPTERYSHLTLEVAFLLNGMFALAARFSREDFWKVSPKHRGDSFALEARNLYEEARRQRETDSPPLEYLQGVLLHTYYLFASRPCSRAWVLVGVCTRLAYDQGLHNIDKDLLSGKRQARLTTEEWVGREEKRRLWWSIWEVDTFASTISCRPYSTDQTRMNVLLPVSDEAWFNNVMVSSAPLTSEPTTMWSSLQNCENQDERAWFIVSKALLRLSHEAAQSSINSLLRNQSIETALACFALSLPSTFHLSSETLIFNRDNFSRSNWIVYTILSLQSARIHVELLKAEGSVGSGDISSEDYARRCRHYITDGLQAVRALSPEYLPLASPFICCSMIGTHCMNFAHKLTNGCDSPSTGAVSVDDMNIAMIRMSLKHVGQYWDLGSLLLEFVRVFVDQTPPDDSMMNSNEKELASHFVNLMPGRLRKLNPQVEAQISLESTYGVDTST